MLHQTDMPSHIFGMIAAYGQWDDKNGPECNGTITDKAISAALSENRFEYRDFILFARAYRQRAAVMQMASNKDQVKEALPRICKIYSDADFDAETILEVFRRARAIIHEYKWTSSHESLFYNLAWYYAPNTVPFYSNESVRGLRTASGKTGREYSLSEEGLCRYNADLLEAYKSQESLIELIMDEFVLEFPRKRYSFGLRVFDKVLWFYAQSELQQSSLFDEILRDSAYGTWAKKILEKYSPRAAE